MCPIGCKWEHATFGSGEREARSPLPSSKHAKHKAITRSFVKVGTNIPFMRECDFGSGAGRQTIPFP